MNFSKFMQKAYFCKLLCNNTGVVTIFLEANMAHEERRDMSKNTDASVDNRSNEHKSTQEQLADANHEIEELKLQIAWLERSYE